MASLQHLNTCSDRQIDAFPSVCEVLCVLSCLLESVCVCECLTLAAAQVLDLDAFLFLTGRLLHLAGVVVGMAIWGTHWVKADVGTVDVANTPKEQEMMLEQQTSSHFVYYLCQDVKLMRSEIQLKISILVLERHMGVFDTDWNLLQGLKTRQKIIMVCTQAWCWTMHINPVQTGFLQDPI